MATNAQWNQALAAWFFSGRSRQQPVYFSVDEDVLTSIASREGWSAADATADFLGAIEVWCYRRQPFLEPFNAMLRWRQSGRVGDPPFLTALAVTVLAATRMGSVKHSRGRYSYYRPLGELLGSGDEHRPDEYDSHVPALWRELSDWLLRAHTGDRGIPTAVAPPDGAYCYIGWSVSQALIRGSDRTSFVQFFTSIGAQAGEDVPVTELLVRFERWAGSGRQRVSDQLAAVLRDVGLRDVLGQSLRFELLRWDGVSQGDVVKPSLPVHLSVSLGMRKSVGVLTRATPRLQACTMTVGTEQVVLGRPDDWAELPIAVRDAVLTITQLPTCTTVDGREVRLSVPREHCFVLVPDNSAGRYVSRAGSELGVEHCVLVRTEVAAAALGVMGQAGEVGRAVHVAGLPAGWLLYRDYVPQRRVEVPPHLAALAPGTGMFPTLNGGLPLDSGSRVYLSGGAPDVVVPPGQPDEVAVALDARTLRVYSTDGGRLPLAGRAGPGDHVLDVGHRHLTFRVVDRLAARGAAGVVAAAGPLLPRVALRSGGRVLAMSDDDEYAEVFPAYPEFLVVAGLQPHLVDVTTCVALLPFTARWVLRVRSGRQTRVQVLRVPQPLRPDTTPPRKTAKVVSSGAALTALVAQIMEADVLVDPADQDDWGAWLAERSS